MHPPLMLHFNDAILNPPTFNAPTSMKWNECDAIMSETDERHEGVKKRNEIIKIHEWN